MCCTCTQAHKQQTSSYVDGVGCARDGVLLLQVSGASDFTSEMEHPSIYIYIDMANPYLCHVSYLFISFFKKFGDGSWRFMFINFQVFIPSPSIDKSLIIRSSPWRPLRSISWWSRRPCRKQPGIGRRKFSRQSMSMGYQHPFIIH